MADNVTANAGSGGAVFATDEDTANSRHVPWTKLMEGADGTFNVVSATNPLPVEIIDVTNTVAADISTLAGAVGGVEMQVDVVAALPAGTNAIGKLAANSGVDIGDVDVTSVVAGTGATNLGKAIDSAVGATDTGVAILGQRDDALSALTPIEGDYVPFRTDANGALWVIPSGTVTVSMATLPDTAAGDLAAINAALAGTLTVGSHAVTNAGTFAVQVDGAALTALQLIDDPVATISATPLMRVGIFDAADTQITSFGGGTQYAVDAALGATPTGTLAIGIRDDALSALTPVEGDAVGLRVDANGALWTIPSGTVTIQEASAIDVSAATVTVDNAGTFAVQVDGDALTALQKIDDPVLVDDAAFTPSTSSVMMAGFEYDDTLPDSVDEGDAGAARMSANRNVYVQVRDAAGNERGLNIDASGNPTVNVTGTVTVGSHDVTNAGTFAVQEDGAALTALQLIDDPIATDDTSTHATGTTKVMGIGAVATPTDGSLDANDIGMPAMSTDRRLHVDADLTAATGVTIDTSNVTIGAALPAGDNNIGNVDIASSVALDVSAATVTVSATQLDVDDLAATADNVGAALMTNVMQNGTTALTPKFAAIDAASSGDNTIVAAVAGKQIRVVSAFLMSAGELTVRFEDGAGGTALTGQMNVTSYSGFVLPFNPVGWFETSATTLLNLELSDAISVDGCLTYVEV